LLPGRIQSLPQCGKCGGTLRAQNEFPELSQRDRSVGQISEIASIPLCKNIPLAISGNQNYIHLVSGPHEGRFAIVTERWVGM
jgi:hypothetical protein